MTRVAHRFTRQPGAISLLAPLALASSAAWAQQSPALDRISLSLGGYYAKAGTTIGASAANDAYRGNLDLEDDLGFQRRQAVPRARLDILVGDRQGFSFDYFSVNRSHARTLQKSVTYRGNNYDTMAAVRGKLEFDFGSAAYRWWFGQGNDVFGLGLGGAWYGAKASIKGEGSVKGDASGVASATTSAHAWAPQLTLGWRHAFNDQWQIYADASGVKKNGGRLHGHIYNLDLGVAWYPWKNVGLGAEYGDARIKLEQERSYYDDLLDMRLEGPSLFVKFRF